MIEELRQVFKKDAELFLLLDDVHIYRKNNMVHGAIGSIITSSIRTVYSGAIDNRFTVAMLRDIIGYKEAGDVCLVTDTPSEFARLRTLLEERYNFICMIEGDIMYSFHFKDKKES